MRDTITLLRHPTHPLAKTWELDGTITPYGQGKYFQFREQRVNNVHELSKLLTRIEGDPYTCIIRGKYIGDENALNLDTEFKPGLVRRKKALFEDQSLHMILIEVDNYRPSHSDPNTDPELCIREYIKLCLPQAFYEISYHWQLSNSAGHPSKVGLLKAHIWFWLATPANSTDLKRWALAEEVDCDSAVFNPVQIHYTARPRFTKGMSDPIQRRSGFVQGVLNDEVELLFPAALATPSIPRTSKNKSFLHVPQDDPVAQLLHEQGLVKSTLANGALAITCPCSADHSGPSTETATVYYPPHTGGYMRWAINCFHSHCENRPRQDYLLALGVSQKELEKTDIDNLSASLSCSLTTHVSNLKRLNDQFGKQIIFCSGQWYIWMETHWANNQDKIFRFVTLIANAVHQEALNHARRPLKPGEDQEVRDDLVKGLKQWARQSEMAFHIEAVIRLAKHHFSVPAGQLNRSPDLLNCANGTVDLRTSEIHRHNPTDYITYYIPIIFDSNAKSDLWSQTTRQITREDGQEFAPLATFLQRWTGYCATGHIREQKFLVHYGSGSNGKSTILDAIANTLGDYAAVAAPGLLVTGRERHPTEIAELFGCRMVTAHESGEGNSLKEEFIKQATGCDKLKARRMRQDFFEFSPTHKLQLVTNYKPRIVGQDYGIWRRVLLMPYAARFGSKLEVDQGRANYEKNSTLAEQLAQQQPAILAWIIEGARQWYATGLNPPDAVVAASEEYKTEQDRIGQFVVECCELGREFEAVFFGQVGSLYQHYNSWCQESGYRPLAKNRFSTELERVVPGLTRKDAKINVGDGRRQDVVKVGGLRLLAALGDGLSV